MFLKKIKINRKIYSWTGKLNISNTSTVPKLTCRFAYNNCQNDARFKKTN